MPMFSTHSLIQIASLHEDLQAICYQVIEATDFRVVQGFRNDCEQEKLFQQGKTKARAGQSKHNQYPSHAMDLYPWPMIEIESQAYQHRQALLAGHVLMTAHALGIDLVWGGHWKKFKDYPHFELKVKE